VRRSGLESAYPPTHRVTSVNRRDWLQIALGASVGLALDGIINLSEVRAATENLKLANISAS